MNAFETVVVGAFFVRAIVVHCITQFFQVSFIIDFQCYSRIVFARF